MATEIDLISPGLYQILLEARALLRKHGHPKVAPIPRWKPREVSRAVAGRTMASISRIWEKAAVDYPVESLRQPLQEALLAIENEILLVISEHYHPRGRPRYLRTYMASSGKPPDYPPGMIVYIPAWLDFVEAIRSVLPSRQAQMCLEDEAVIILLHEWFHISREHHRLTVFEAEAECWYYTYRSIVQPMADNGRAPVIKHAGTDLLGRLSCEITRLIGEDMALWVEFMRINFSYHDGRLPRLRRLQVRSG